MVGVIDIGLSNTRSVCRALDHIGVSNRLLKDPDQLQQAEKLILPGVGSFQAASKRLSESGFRDEIRAAAIGGMPVLGICLGMQLLGTRGHEAGISEGLDLIKAEVVPMDAPEFGLRLPHVGWNDLVSNNTEFLRNHEPGTCFYFVHSYTMRLTDPSVQFASCEYGSEFVAAVQQGTIMGTQFHPEKSQAAGLAVLRSFTS